MRLVKELWDYREMIISLTRRDLKSRYKGSVLGVLWMFVDPLLQLAVYTIVFSTIMPMGIEKFYLFLFVALVPWIFFNVCLSSGTGIILGQQDMVKKIHFPREVLPIAFTTGNFVNMLLSFIVIFIVIIFSGIGINPVALLYLPLVMIIEFMLALGVTLLTSGLTVYFRDLQHFIGVLLQLFFYATPIVYAVDVIPANFQWILKINPMTYIIEGYRDIFWGQTMPEIGTLLIVLAIGIVLCILGYLIFNKLKKKFAEEL